MTRPGLGLICVVLLASGAAGCASTGGVAPPPAATPIAPVVSIERKAGWILRLEQSRILSDDALGTGADLAVLSRDPDPGIRRRAVVALGRVGMSAGVEPATAALADSEEAVRAAAAFALGLLASPDGVAALQAALADPSPLVRGRAAEGLGLVGQAAVAPAIADAAAGCATVIAPLSPDDEERKSGVEEACRLSILALVRLRQFDALARVVLDNAGAPVSRWWPIAFALQRSGDRRAAGPLAALASGPGIYTRAFAIRGLAALKDPRTADQATRIASQPAEDVRLRAEAVRALGRIGAREAVPMLAGLVEDRATPAPLMLEAIGAIGAIGDARAFDMMLDLFASPSPVIRSAAMAAAGRLDPDSFLLALSGRERDRDWSVRANLATILARLPAEKARPALEDLLKDPDVRVHGPALRAFSEVLGPAADDVVLKALQAPDFVVRGTAAALVGDRRPAGGAVALAAAYVRSESDANHSARVAVLEALAKYPAAEGRETLVTALGDREWAVRLAAARLLRQGGVTDATPVRPAPIRQDAEFFESDRLLRPVYTPQAYIQTRAGTIQLELDVVGTPFTTIAFIDLARSGFFDGLKIHRLIPNFVIQAGDPRGDGEGGPGYAIRDELSPVPFVRGTLGMALDGRDTGGSQFFITLSPQPHLDGQYTAFGRVVAGWDVLDRLSLGDVIDRVLIRDGNER